MNNKQSASRQVVGKRRQRSHVQERGNVRRRQLLEAAEEMLEYTPIEELSFIKVCMHAGVPEGSAYHFFANRYDLLTSLSYKVAADFAKEYLRPIPPRNVDTWHDIVSVLVRRAVRLYRKKPAARQIWLSGRVPADIRLADHVTDAAVSHDIQLQFERHFQLPALPAKYDIFFHFLELCDVPLSLSIIEHGKITQELAAESERVGIAYLGIYLPPKLQKVR